MTDLHPDALQRALAPRPWQFFESVDSTNDIAMRWLLADAAAGAVVIADEQRRGRGRMGRTWHTPPGVALALSVVLRPSAASAHLMGMLGALAVAELCEHLGILHVGIKYPNDVQIGGCKVCGILPEAAWKQEQLLGIVLGIGVNVRVTFEAELARQATNLEDAAGQALDRTALIALILSRLDAWTDPAHSAGIFAAWRRRLTTIGQRVTIGDVSGTAEDVDSSGALLVRTDAHRLERVLAGDVLLHHDRDR